MRLMIVSTMALLATACARNVDSELPVPLTNSPAARQTATSSTAGLADASAQLSPTKGNNASGELRFTAGSEGVRVMGTVTGLDPNGEHGIHIHANGDCSAPDASSAGGHFNPLGHPHGPPGSASHVGDLGNVKANHAGVAYLDVQVAQATLHSGAATDISNRAVIVHAKPDDLRSQPSGDSGARIACGVIS
jgi:superoxide dismutase, Cu-Zn family